MAFLRRILSGDYRRAVAAEAAGDYAEAARHYALAGERDKVAEMHLLRSERAANAAEAESELRDALRWTAPGTPGRARVARALGSALMKRVHAEGATTVRDQERVRSAAGLLDEAGEHRDAGAAWELIGDDENAARAYEKGGHLDEMEDALRRERDRRRGADLLREAFAVYEISLQSGARRAALAALGRCVDLSGSKGDYIKLADGLRARLPGAHLTLRARPSGHAARFVVADHANLGRDPDAGLPLRTPGVSRSHAEIRFAGGSFTVRDAGSRHGTWLHDLPLAGAAAIALADDGQLRLGADCHIGYRAAGSVLRLEIARGLDRGALFYVVPAETAIDLEPLLGIAAGLWFQDGWPRIEGQSLVVNGLPAASVVEPLRGDVIGVAVREVDVL